MVKNGWRKPDGNWDISALHKKTGGSRRWLYKLIRGETGFGIDDYERILRKGFGLSFEVIMAGRSPSPIPRDVEDLHERLTDAIANSKETNTLEALRYAVYALADKTALDRALQDKTENKAHAPPRPSSREGEDATEGRAAASRHKHKKTGSD